MNMKRNLSVVYIDDNVGVEARRLFGITRVSQWSTVDCGGGERSLSIYPMADLGAFLVDIQTAPASVESGYRLFGRDVDGILLDVDFSALPSGKIPDLRRVLDMGGEDFKWHRVGLLAAQTFKRIDPDFPVLLFTSVSAEEIEFRAGKIGVDEFLSKNDLSVAGDLEKEARLGELWSRLAKALDICHKRALYDRQHMVLADKFSADYDKAEKGKVATVAYYKYENDLILESLREIEPGSTDRPRLLDVGCGTGRIAELLLRAKMNVEYVGVDFSGRMIEASGRKMRAAGLSSTMIGSQADLDGSGMSATFFKAPGESLAFLAERYPDGFDFIALGFGFLSYVNYLQVLGSVSQEDSGKSSGAASLLRRRGGLLLVSVYNEGSAIYERIQRVDSQEADLPIAAVVDPIKGKLHVDDYQFDCELFTESRLCRFMRQSGLTIKDPPSSFPTLHLLMDNQLPEGAGEYTLMSEAYYNPFLFQIDKRAGAVVPGRGHYIVALARRD